MRRPALSRRRPWGARPNRLARAVARRRSAGHPVVDLTVANPTTTGISYPAADLAAALAAAATAPYQPDPLGLRSAREALAAALSTAADPVSPDDLVLAASTSEAYALLFKVLADPGDAVLTATPGYPLLDELAALEGLRLSRFPLDAEAGFAVDPARAAAAVDRRTRMLAVVHPSHPLGRWLYPDELAALDRLCSDRGLVLMVDEVFAEYPLAAASPRASAIGGARDAVTVGLGGLSKSAGLPGWKLGWIRLGGPIAARRRLRSALERAADAYLSLATPVQMALPEILRHAPAIRSAILDRVRGNLDRLTRTFAAVPEVRVLRPGGGWSAVLRVPAVLPDEELAVRLLDRAGVLVQPGYLFDFHGDGYLVVSLLPEPADFEPGMEALRDVLAEIRAETA